MREEWGISFIFSKNDAALLNIDIHIFGLKYNGVIGKGLFAKLPGTDAVKGLRSCGVRQEQHE